MKTEVEDLKQEVVDPKLRPIYRKLTRVMIVALLALVTAGFELVLLLQKPPQSAESMPRLGEYNTAVGWRSSELLTTGSRNLTAGYQTGTAITVGNANTILGGNIPGTPTMSNEVFLGDGDGHVVFHATAFHGISDRIIGHNAEIVGGTIPLYRCDETGALTVKPTTCVLAMDTGIRIR